MVEWEVTIQSSVRVTTFLYLFFILMYLHKIVSQKFLTPCDVHSKNRQVLIIKLGFWTRVRFSILD